MPGTSSGQRVFRMRERRSARTEASTSIVNGSMRIDAPPGLVPGEDVGTVRETCRRVQLVVGVTESELLQRPPRSSIAGVMAGEQGADLEGCERVLHHAPGRFGGKALAPLRRAQVEPELEGALPHVAWTQSAA